MFKKISLIFIALLPLVATSCSFNIPETNDNNINLSVNKAPEIDFTIQEFADYLSDKKEHYPLSDEFIERYQQTSGGYIDYARQCDIPVDKMNHSPNQKWHFFYSWIEYGEIDTSLSAYSRVYIGLKCPELLLWIYEAMGVNPNKVKEAKIVAEQGKVNKDNVSTIASAMRSKVTWDDLIKDISK